MLPRKLERWEQTELKEDELLVSIGQVRTKSFPSVASVCCFLRLVALCSREALSVMCCVSPERVSLVGPS
eukprot:s7_g54.t1